MAHAKLNWLMTLQAHHLFGEEDVIVFHLFGSGVAVGREHVAAFGRGFKRGGAEAAEDMSAQNLCVLSASAFLLLNTPSSSGFSLPACDWNWSDYADSTDWSGA